MYHFKHKELRWGACCHVYNHDIDKHHWEWIWGNHMIAPVAVKQPWRIWVDKLHKSRRRCKHNHVTKLRKTKLYAWCTDYTVYMIWHCADYIKLGSLVHDEEPQPLSPVGFAYGPAFCLIYTTLSICLASSRHFRQKNACTIVLFLLCSKQNNWDIVEIYWRILLEENFLMFLQFSKFVLAGPMGHSLFSTSCYFRLSLQ